MTDITKPQMEILHHTKWRAANSMYCGDRSDPDLQALCDAKLMRYLGTKAWLPQTEGYFTITLAGLDVLAANPTPSDTE